MERVVQSWVCGLSALAFASNAAALEGNLPALYHLGESARIAEILDSPVPQAVAGYRLELNEPTKELNQPSFLLELPSGEIVEARRRRFVDYSERWKSWSGSLFRVGEEVSQGEIQLGGHDGRLSAMFDFEGERYRIVGGALGSEYHLYRLADGLEATCVLGNTRATEKVSLSGASEATVNSVEASTSQRITTSRLDVLAIYPKEFFISAVNEIYLIDFVEDSIALANNAFVNSNVPAYYNLVYVGPIVGAQPPATGISDGLDWLNTQPAEVVSLRGAFRADIVAMFIPYYWNNINACGVANLPRNNNTFQTGSGIVNAPMGNRAFSVNRDGCGLGDFTLGHEIGHNYGMRHNDASTAGSNALFPNGRGHLLTLSSGTKATVMGCVSPSTQQCIRIPHFSDPAISFQGVATGTSTRNNAEVARIQVQTYDDFFLPTTNTPPTASFTFSCTGRTCSFNASSSTDNATLPTGGFWWDFGDGTTGAGKIVTKTFANAGSRWIHLVVTDSGGQQDFGADLVTVP